MISLRKLEASKKFRPCDVTTKPCLKLTCKISFFKASYLQMIFYMFFPCFQLAGVVFLGVWISFCGFLQQHLRQALQLRRVSHGYGTKDDEEYELLKAKHGAMWGLVKVGQVVRGATWGGWPPHGFSLDLWGFKILMIYIHIIEAGIS